METTTDWFQRAQWMLAGEIAGFVALSLLLRILGVSTDWLFVALLLVNLATAVSFARAAAGMGKSPALHGVIAAVGPPGAILTWARLKSARVFGEPTGAMAVLPVVSEVGGFERDDDGTLRVSFAGAGLMYVLYFPRGAMPEMSVYKGVDGTAMSLSWAQARELLQRIGLAVDAETRGREVFDAMVAVAARDGRRGQRGND